MKTTNLNQTLKDYSYRAKLNSKTIAIEPISTYEADGIIKSVEDLIDDVSYKPFFYSKLYGIGKDKFLEKADQARRYSKTSGRFFVHLIKA